MLLMVVVLLIVLMWMIGGGSAAVCWSRWLGPHQLCAVVRRGLWGGRRQSTDGAPGHCTRAQTGKLTWALSVVASVQGPLRF